MTNSKLRNDASASFDGVVYQLYAALKYAFELKEDQMLYIEKFGDVTVDSDMQIEVKQYSDDLTDTHYNLWNTLLNWLDPNFDLNSIGTLILLTTQKYGSNSKLKEWNDLSAKSRLELLESISAKYLTRERKDKSKVELLNKVLDNGVRKKLNLVLSKFVIITSNPRDDKLYNQLVQTHAKNIPSENQGHYIKALLGFVISPKSTTDDKWTISCDEFECECQKLAKMLITSTTLFPRVESIENIDDYRDYLFVKKIEEIEYDEEINNAIRDFVEVHSLIIKEFSGRLVSKKKYREYEKELIQEYVRAYRKASRRIREDDVILESQDFYDEIMNKHPIQFMNYSDTPLSFKNGILHLNADDKDINVKWKLGDKHVKSD